MMRSMSEMPFLKYRCIVCNMAIISINELHYHQTYWHSPEELSLSVINLQGLLNGNNSFSEPKIDQPYWNNSVTQPQMYALPANLLNDDDNNNVLVQSPANYMSIAKNTAIENTFPLEHLKIEYGQPRVISTKTDPSNIHESQLNSLCFENDTRTTQNNEVSPADIPRSNSFDNSLEMELSEKVEISEEVFLNSVNGLCTDLEKIKDKTVKRKNLQKNGLQARELLKLQQGKQIICKDTRENLKSSYVNPVMKTFPVTEHNSPTDKSCYIVNNPVKVPNERTKNASVAKSIYSIGQTDENIAVLNFLSNNSTWSSFLENQSQPLEKTRAETKSFEGNSAVFQEAPVGQEDIHCSKAPITFSQKCSDINQSHVTSLNCTNETRLNNIESTTYTNIFLNNDEETFYQNW